MPAETIEAARGGGENRRAGTNVLARRRRRHIVANAGLPQVVTALQRYY
jgi:hypothetical protein